MSQKPLSYRGISFYKLMGAFFVVVFLFAVLTVGLTLHFMNQNNQATETSYAEMANKVLQSAPSMVAGYYQIADLIADIPEIGQLSCADTFPIEAQEAKQFWNHFDSVYHSTMSGAGNVACLYFQKSNHTMGLGSYSNDPYLSGEMTGDFGLTEEQWQYLITAGTQTRAFCLKTDQMSFGRLMLSKEIYPNVVLLAGITDFNLQNTLQNFYLPPNSQAILLTSDDRFISSTKEQNPLDGYLSFTQISSMADSKTIDVSESPYFLFHTPFAEGSVEQIVLIPNTIQDGQLQMILNVVLFALFSWLVAGGIFSYLFASRFYRPIGKLVHDLPVQDIDKNDPHEFQVVSTAVQKLYQQAQNYEQQLNQQNHLLADSLLLRLLQGELSFSDEVESAFSHVGFTLTSPFVILMAQPELSEVLDSSKSVPSLDTLQEILSNFLAESDYSCYLTEYRGLLIGPVCPPLGSESSIELVLRKLQEHIHSSLDVPLSMVLSEIHISHAEFFDAYREASETWEYNLLIGEAGTVRQFQSSHRLSEYDSSSVFLNNMRKLENCLQAENDQEGISCIRHIFQTLSAGTPDAAPSIQRRLHYLFDTVRLYLCERDESSSLSKRKDITPKKGQNLDDLCEELCDALHAIQKAEEDDPLKKRKIHQITQYIQENYQDPNLSAGAIAEQFHISLPWLSNLFKRELHINFLDYLHRYRIKKAKDLILQTKYNIGDIAEMVGYTNAVTMTRAFKRYEGITPSWYRQNPPVGQKRI